jgi:hypothetical protein
MACAIDYSFLRTAVMLFWPLAALLCCLGKLLPIAINAIATVHSTQGLQQGLNRC